VLNGEGGDPCFGGPKNIPMILAELYGDRDDAGDDFAREKSYLRSHGHAYDDLADMLAADLRGLVTDRVLERELRPHLADPRWRALVQRLMAVNVTFKGGHHILPKVDALSAPAGVRPRSPLFHRRIVELAFAIPPKDKLRGTIEKWLLKEAVTDVVPREIVDRPKSGMLVPVEAWFRGPLRAMARERILDGLRPWRLFEQAWLERLVEGRNLGLRPRWGRKLWLLVTLESWLRTMSGW
jgi:asparagine synthase (glutamine-hydrolysing)